MCDGASLIVKQITNLWRMVNGISDAKCYSWIWFHLNKSENNGMHSIKFRSWNFGSEFLEKGKHKIKSSKQSVPISLYFRILLWNAFFRFVVCILYICLSYPSSCLGAWSFYLFFFFNFSCPFESSLLLSSFS